MSHIFTEPSSDPDATHLASGESYTVFTLPVCSRYVNPHLAVLVSQTLTLVSSDPVTSVFYPIASLIKQEHFV